jgi:DNA-binding transcriptional LysR family regulator
MSRVGAPRLARLWSGCIRRSASGRAEHRVPGRPQRGRSPHRCPPFLAASFVSAVVDRLARRYPNVASHLVIAQADALTSELSERNVDFLIAARFGHLADERREFEALFDDSHVVVAGVQHPLVRRRKIRLSDLMDSASVTWRETSLSVSPPPHSRSGGTSGRATIS